MYFFGPPCGGTRWPTCGAAKSTILFFKFRERQCRCKFSLRYIFAITSSLYPTSLRFAGMAPCACALYTLKIRVRHLSHSNFTHFISIYSSKGIVSCFCPCSSASFCLYNCSSFFPFSRYCLTREAISS